MISVIYAITNTINDKQYVGQAVNKDKRWKNHKIALRTNKHSNRHLQSAHNKYGVENFIYTVLEIVSAGPNLKERLAEREQYWMNKLNCVTPNGYNLNPSAGSALGFKHTEETKIKWSEQRKGQKRSAEFSLSVSIRMTGKIVTDETRKKQSEAQTGTIKSEITKDKHASNMKGNKHAAGQNQTAEHIEARAKVLRGVPKTAEHKAKIAASNRGKTVSPETRQRQSEAAKNRKPSKQKPLDEI